MKRIFTDHVVRGGKGTIETYFPPILTLDISLVENVVQIKLWDGHTFSISKEELLKELE